MSLSNASRRIVLLAAFAVASCGFTPAYGPTGGAGKLSNNVLVKDPATRDQFVLTRRIEDRLGRPATPAYALDVSIKREDSSIGVDQSGGATRFHLVGTATYALKQIGTTLILTEGAVTSFTGYSNTGSTVSELAARKDAEDRLMVILADQIVDKLIIAAPDLPQ